MEKIWARVKKHMFNISVPIMIEPSGAFDTVVLSDRFSMMSSAESGHFSSETSLAFEVDSTNVAFNHQFHRRTTKKEPWRSTAKGYLQECRLV